MKQTWIFAATAFMCIVFSSYSQEYWIHKPSPIQSNLSKIIFVDSLYGWASGDSGKIIHTSNGGTSWTVQNTGITDYPIEDIFFLNRNLGWGVANDFFFFGTKMLKTTDGGLNWERTVYPDTTKVFNTIYFMDPLNGYLSGFTGEIMRTTDGGINWTNCRLDTNFCPPLYLFPKASFDFLNAQTGFVCGGHLDIQGIIWKTTDGGFNWFSYCVTSEPLRRIKALSPNRVIATGGDYEYGPMTATSFDGGNAWVYDTIGGLGIGSALAFRTNKEVWVPLDFIRKWAISLDTGSITAPWYFVNTPDTTTIKDAVFASPTLGWACGFDGALLKYNPAVIGITENNMPGRYALYQNYPNPFNPVTTIKYYIPKNSSVVITVFDIAGREVRRFNEGFRLQGMHSLVFSSLNLASGVYLYKLETGEFSESKKMVILK
jgi:photosystem II stability/assembly factor-like uncharacterized protein